MADQLANLPPVVAFSGQGWQYQISTVIAHIDRYISAFLLLDLYC